MKVKRKKSKMKILQGLVPKALFLWLLTSLSSSGALHAQTLKDIIYPSSVPMYAGKSFPRLTKNDIEEVKSFYRTAIKKIQGESELVETEKSGEGPGSVCYHFGFRNNVQGVKVMRADGMSICSVDKDLYVKELQSKGTGHLSSGSVPLKHLQDIVNFHQAGSTQEDYNKLASQYQNLSYAFFKVVQVAPQEIKSEDEVIYEKYYRQVYGAPVMPAKEPGEYDTEKKKKMEETAKRIKELRAQGKMREALELSAKLQQEIKQGVREAGGPDLMQASKRAMSKEAWDIWVQCLKEMHTAAYRSRIEYSGPLTMYEEDLNK